MIKTNSLAEVGRVFLRLGTTSFGGPAAHIAMMEEEIVARRQKVLIIVADSPNCECREDSGAA